MLYFCCCISVSGVLPSMISRRTGHLVLINSIQGKLTVPFRTTCEFKSLWQELGCRLFVLFLHRSLKMKTNHIDMLFVVYLHHFIYIFDIYKVINTFFLVCFHHSTEYCVFLPDLKMVTRAGTLSCVTIFPDAASKHAVQAFFDCLRAEVEEYGISVSTINHTFISCSASEDTASSRSIWSCE